MTNGAGGVTSGGARWPAWAIAYAVLIGATLLINTVNVLSLLDERVVMDRPLPWWEPAVWEATSGGVLLGLAWIPMLMVVRFSPERPDRLRSAGAHIAATVPFSLAHVGLMVALREAAYALAGEVYDFDGGTGALLYEYRKDFVSYVIFAAIFWITLRSRRRGDAVAAIAAPAPGMLPIDEGSPLVRVPTTEILAVRSSGNYVEFLLADGRRLLMRTTLARVETRLAGAGFVRTHRSWLANPDHVVEAVAEGSGDYGLRLGDGTQIPLSRRYPDALASLRSGRTGAG